LAGAKLKTPKTDRLEGGKNLVCTVKGSGEKSRKILHERSAWTSPSASRPRRVRGGTEKVYVKRRQAARPQKKEETEALLPAPNYNGRIRTKKEAGVASNVYRNEGGNGRESSTRETISSAHERVGKGASLVPERKPAKSRGKAQRKVRQERWGGGLLPEKRLGSAERPGCFFLCLLKEGDRIGEPVQGQKELNIAIAR